MAPDAPPPLAFSFDAEHHLAPDELITLLGGKGCGLAVMTAMGLPVPPGFTLTTEAWRRHAAHGWNPALDEALRAGLAELEQATGRTLGAGDDPLVVSVRSGAEVSMPGMLDTVLDVGMTTEVAEALARRTGDPQFAADTLRRSLLGYAGVVGAASAPVLRTARDADDPVEVRRRLAAAGIVVPDDPVTQVVHAVEAVFRSWSSPAATRFREVEGIPHSIGTAVTVQQMVFGNLGDSSGTGVAFTRDPSTGEPGLMGDHLPCAQGEDVVAGRRAPRPLAEMAGRWPAVWDELVGSADRLEREFADMVDIEFTVERGRLWLLQARRGRRSAAAAMRIAVDLARDETFPVDRTEAVRRCRHLLAPVARPAGGAAVAADGRLLATGAAASPGRASGVLCLDIDEAVRLQADGVPVVLVRSETSPADVHGMAASVGLVTTVGGLVSHAAVVARSWGIPAVVGAGDLVLLAGAVEGNGLRAAVGEVVTVDGDTGRLLLGGHAGPATEPPEAAILRAWARTA